MEDIDYIKKEALMLYNYMLDDGERFGQKKHIYARLFNSIKSTTECQLGGLECLDLSTTEIKSIIKQVVDNHPIQLVLTKKD